MRGDGNVSAGTYTKSGNKMTGKFTSSHYTDFEGEAG